MDQLINTLRAQVIEALQLEEIAPEEIDPSAPLFGDGLGLNSIDALELVVMLEREYNLKITDMEVGKLAFASLQAMATFIQEQQECSENQ